MLHKAAVAQLASAPSGSRASAVIGRKNENDMPMLRMRELNQLPRGTFDFYVSGHHARPDICRLVVAGRPKRAVLSLAAAG